MKHPRLVIQDWIDRVNDEGCDLNDWELHFMESITDQFIDRELSDRQEEILERIYANKTK